MSIINFIKAYLKFKPIEGIIIYDNGGFELPSEYLFKDKEKTLEYIRKLNKITG